MPQNGLLVLWFCPIAIQNDKRVMKQNAAHESECPNHSTLLSDTCGTLVGHCCMILEAMLLVGVRYGTNQRIWSGAICRFKGADDSTRTNDALHSIKLRWTLSNSNVHSNFNIVVHRQYWQRTRNSKHRTLQRRTFSDWGTNGEGAVVPKGGIGVGLRLDCFDRSLKDGDLKKHFAGQTCGKPGWFAQTCDFNTGSISSSVFEKSTASM